MSHVTTERRIAQRIQIKDEIRLRPNSSKTLNPIYATANDISPGGIQFAVPWGTDLFPAGEILELIFKLPQLGETLIQSKVCHSRFGIDTDYNRLIFYGAKFVDLPVKTRTSLMDHYKVETQPEPVAANQPKPLIERKDPRVTAVDLIAQIKFPEGRSCYAQVEDLSYGGIKVKTPIPLKANSHLKLRFLSRDPVVFNAICAWSNPGDPKKLEHSAGIIFNQLSSEGFNLVHSLLFNSNLSAGPSAVARQA